MVDEVKYHPLEEDERDTGRYRLGEVEAILSSVPPDFSETLPPPEDGFIADVSIATLPPLPDFPDYADPRDVDGPLDESLEEELALNTLEVFPDPFPSTKPPPPEEYPPPNSRPSWRWDGGDVIIVDDDGEWE